jgi:hypothetical protein
VLLELLIVVLGIFIGLQVDGWNESRRDRADEQLYLARLSSDLEETLADLASDRDSLAAWSEQTFALVSGLAMGESGRVLVERNKDAFNASSRVLLGRPQLATLTELIEGGQLGLIRNPTIRSAIAEVRALTESRQLQIQVLSRQQQVLAEIIRPNYRITPGPDGGRNVGYDFAALAGDDVLINALSQAAEHLRVNVIWFEEIIAVMEALSAHLSAED